MNSNAIRAVVRISKPGWRRKRLTNCSSDFVVQRVLKRPVEMRVLKRFKVITERPNQIMPRSCILVCARFCLLLLLCLVTGCGGKTEKSFIPKANHAEEALDTALKEWQSGTTYGTIESFSVGIDVFDSRWKQGKKLESFEILREEESEGPKTFVVKMKLAGEQESEIKYLVIGLDPLLIYAEPDYLKSSGM